MKGQNNYIGTLRFFLALDLHGSDFHLLNNVGLCASLFSCIQGVKSVSPGPYPIYEPLLQRISSLSFPIKLLNSAVISARIGIYSQESNAPGLAVLPFNSLRS